MSIFKSISNQCIPAVELANPGVRRRVAALAAGTKTIRSAHLEALHPLAGPAIRCDDYYLSCFRKYV